MYVFMAQDVPRFDGSLPTAWCAVPYVPKPFCIDMGLECKICYVKNRGGGGILWLALVMLLMLLCYLRLM
jgi:hypothetical protein